MNKTLITATLFFLGRSAVAQQGIDNLARAEKNFAAYSVAHSTKEAFLAYIDSNSVMFENGTPVKALDFWNNREKKPGVLNWRPQYMEISVSGDFGYTTGPWTFQNSLTDPVIARGQYATVWALNKKGEWKFLADLGIDNKEANDGREKIINAPKQTERYTGHQHPLANAESGFNDLFPDNRSKAYKVWLSKESILTRNGYLPAQDDTSRKKIIGSTPAEIRFTTAGMGVSPAQDMGYTYGTATISGKAENYLRIWRREKNGWRIALEVLRY